MGGILGVWDQFLSPGDHNVVAGKVFGLVEVFLWAHEDAEEAAYPSVQSFETISSAHKGDLLWVACAVEYKAFVDEMGYLAGHFVLVVGKGVQKALGKLSRVAG